MDPTILAFSLAGIAVIICFCAAVGREFVA